MSRLAPRTPLDFISLGYQLTAHCVAAYQAGGCRHSGPVLMETVGAMLGLGFDLYAGRQLLLARLICSRCGARFPDTILCPVAPVATGPLPHLPMALDLLPVDEAVRRALALSASARARNAAIGYTPPSGRGRRKFGPHR